MLGCGSVGQCTLPLLLRHLDIPAARITVMDFTDVRPKIAGALRAGVAFVQARVTPQDYATLFSQHVKAGDLIVDLSWNVETLDLLEWCGEHDVRYINTSVEEWDPYANVENQSPYDRSLYFRQMRIRKLKAKLAARGRPPVTAIIDHGANPGLVSHFTKRALLEIGAAMLEKGIPPAAGVDAKRMERLIADAEAYTEGSYARLSQATGTKVIHISERDTQISSQPKLLDEFVNTWSIEGFYEEGTAPSELGWGTHERRLPPYAHTPIGGPGNQIFIAQPGIRTFVHSWVPLGGEIIGMVVRHAESFTISDHLTVWDEAVEGRRAVYRPTVHYAYMPCDNAILSLYELTMRNYKLQPKLRIMSDEITEGLDELGVLLLGHGLNGWWTGSQLDIHEARQLVPGQNATTLQVAAGVLSGVIWMIRNPNRGILVPDELDHREIFDVALPYLGPCPSVQTDWTPVNSRSRLFARWGRPALHEPDVWQFANFSVDS
jgi:homospermidine synthase